MIWGHSLKILDSKNKEKFVNFLTVYCILSYNMSYKEQNNRGKIQMIKQYAVSLGAVHTHTHTHTHTDRFNQNHTRYNEIK